MLTITRRLPFLVNLFGILTMGISLVSYAYLGTFSRYYADDYCMSGLVVQRGFWQAQIEQYMTWSNRYTGMLLLSLSDLLGVHSIRFWTALVLAVWLASMSWAIGQAKRYFGLHMPTGLGVLLAEIVLCLSLWLSPQVYQSLYWRVGIITYTLPLVFLCLLAGLVFRFASRIHPGKLSWLNSLAILLLAFIAGGFSETYLTLQTGIFILALVMVGITANASEKRAWLAHLGAGLAGSIAALVVVFLAPGNAIRQAALPPPPGIFSLGQMTLGHTFLFLYETLDANAFQLFLAFSATLLLGYLTFSEKVIPDWKPSRLVLSFLGTGLVAAVLVVGVMLPPAYAQSSYPDGRVLIEAAFLVALGVVCTGTLLGLIFAQLHQVAHDPVAVPLQWLAAGLAMVILLYPLYDARKNYLSIPQYRETAAVWDGRDARIRTARLSGIVEIAEKANNPPGGLAELTPEATNWVNACAAWFYDLDAITAGK